MATSIIKECELFRADISAMTRTLENWSRPMANKTKAEMRFIRQELRYLADLIDSLGVD